MSLNNWSIVMFISTFVFYLSVYSVMFRNPNLSKFALVSIVWVLNMLVTLVYGIATDQIGFVLIFLLELAYVIQVYIITERMRQDGSI